MVAVLNYTRYSSVLFFPRYIKFKTRNGADFENGQASMMDHTSQSSISRADVTEAQGEELTCLDLCRLLISQQ